LSFGRYRNVALLDVPRSYLAWIVRTDGIPAADRWAAEQFLAATSPRRRRGRRR
jgi:hypothetical protein